MHIQSWQRLASFTSFCSKVTNVAPCKPFGGVQTSHPKRKGILFRSQKKRGLKTNKSVKSCKIPNPQNEPTKWKYVLKKHKHTKIPDQPTLLFSNDYHQPPTPSAQTWIQQAPILVEDAMTPPAAGDACDFAWQGFATVFVGAWWNFACNEELVIIMKLAFHHVYMHGFF